MDERRRALKYRSHHRGTREADMMIGGFFDAHQDSMSEADMDWFEALLQEQDVDIMAWAIGTLPVPARYHGPMLAKLQKLDFIRIAR